MQLPDMSNFIPFLLSAGMKQPHWNLQRVIEALLIGAITGGIAMWGTQQVIATQMQALEKQVIEVKTELREIRSDIYRPVIGRDK